MKEAEEDVELKDKERRLTGLGAGFADQSENDAGLWFGARGRHFNSNPLNMPQPAVSDEVCQSLFPCPFECSDKVLPRFAPREKCCCAGPVVVCPPDRLHALLILSCPTNDFLPLQLVASRCLHHQDPLPRPLLVLSRRTRPAGCLAGFLLPQSISCLISFGPSSFFRMGGLLYMQTAMVHVKWTPDTTLNPSWGLFVRTLKRTSTRKPDS